MVGRHHTIKWGKTPGSRRNIFAVTQVRRICGNKVEAANWKTVQNWVNPRWQSGSTGVIWRTEYRAIRKVSKMEQQRSSLYLQTNILSLEHIKTDKWNTHPALFQNLSILVGTTKPVRTDGTEQNPFIRRSQTTEEIYNGAKQVLQAI